MIELPLEYWNKLVQQIILISSLLSGFSIAVIASLLVYESNNQFIIYILKSATIAAACFLITIFAMTKILMMTTQGYPVAISEKDFALPRHIGLFTFILGISSLLFVISLSGWAKSRSVGIFTTSVGILSLILIFSMLVDYG